MKIIARHERKFTMSSPKSFLFSTIVLAFVGPTVASGQDDPSQKDSVTPAIKLSYDVNESVAATLASTSKALQSASDALKSVSETKAKSGVTEVRALSVSKDIFSIIKDLLAILGVPAAIGIYYFKVVLQRQYQRLSGKIELATVDLRENMNVSELTLNVANEAECRINISRTKFSVWACEPYRRSDSSLIRSASFERNLGTRPAEQQDAGTKVNYDRFSVDAKSTIDLSTLIDVPRDVKLVVIEVEFSPDLTSETYKVSRFCGVNPVSNCFVGKDK